MMKTKVEDLTLDDLICWGWSELRGLAAKRDEAGRAWWALLEVALPASQVELNRLWGNLTQVGETMVFTPDYLAALGVRHATDEAR